MKKIYISLMALLAMVFIAGCQGQSERIYPYPFDTARIEMALTGGLEGTTVVQIKGDKSSHETHAVSTVNGEEERTDMLLIDTGAELYSVNLNTKQAIKTENPITKQLKELSKEQRVDFLTRLAVGVGPDEDQGPEAVSTREVAGQKCDVYNINNFGDICIWYGIPLASSVSLPDLGLENRTEATGIQLNVDVPDSVFEVPGGIAIQ